MKQPAGLNVRIKAFAWDYLPIAGYLVLVAALASLANAFYPSVVQDLFGNPRSGQLYGFLLVTLPVSLYFVLGDSSPFLGTRGKQRIGLRVIDNDGGRLTFSRATARTALKFTPWELAHVCIWQVRFAPEGPTPLVTIGLVTVWILVGANVVSLIMSPARQTLYDRLAGTRVVTP